ncbi:MAG TPA: trehalose-phosphatase [Thermoanaerobaculia bacterium]|jgi:trehalose-phosphatase|nr:trehalose-phosphatase [Thermoanaerobaculia bacterium]
MKTLDDTLDLDAFWASVSSAPRRALLLDYDGTLAPFSTDRLQPRMRDGVAETVTDIARLGRTRVAIVSGRGARELRSLLPPDLPAEVWGSHGLERLEPSGTYAAPPLEPRAAELRDAFGRWVRERGHELNLEMKPFGFALHRRADPDAYDRLRPETLARWRAEAAAAGFDFLEFDGGFEFRPSGRHKGEVVRYVLAEEGPGVAAAYLGDDWTDEDAFDALRAAGRGLSVLVRAEVRPTHARAWIAPEELGDFLHRWSEASPRS